MGVCTEMRFYHFLNLNSSIHILIFHELSRIIRRNMSTRVLKHCQRRRDKERLRHETESFLHQHNNTRRITEWENKTRQKIEQVHVANLKNELLKEDEEQLRARQNELQSRYSNELSQWKAKLRESMVVPEEQKMETIRQRAFALKNSREKERLEFVEKCYNMQWKDGCDELRAMESKARTNRLVDDRRKSANRTQTGLYEDEFICQELGPITQRDEYEQVQRRKANLEMKRALDQQIEWKRSHMASVVAKNKMEEQEQLHNLAETERLAAERNKRLVEKAKEGGNAMKRETMDRAMQLEKWRQLEKKNDLILLQHALKQEQMQLNSEKSKREEGKEAGKEYMKCLQDQLKVDHEANLRINKIRNEEFEKIALAQEEKIGTQVEQRKQAIEGMKKSRQEQIRRKKEEEGEIKKESQRESEKHEEELRRHEKEELSRKHLAYTKKKEVDLSNKEMIEQKEEGRKRKDQEKILAREQFKIDERIYQEKKLAHMAQMPSRAHIGYSQNGILK